MQDTWVCDPAAEHHGEAASTRDGLSRCGSGISPISTPARAQPASGRRSGGRRCIVGSPSAGRRPSCSCSTSTKRPLISPKAQPVAPPTARRTPQATSTSPTTCAAPMDPPETSCCTAVAATSAPAVTASWDRARPAPPWTTRTHSSRAPPISTPASSPCASQYNSPVRATPHAVTAASAKLPKQNARVRLSASKPLSMTHSTLSQAMDEPKATAASAAHPRVGGKARRANRRTSIVTGLRSRQRFAHGARMLLHRGRTPPTHNAKELISSWPTFPFIQISHTNSPA